MTAVAQAAMESRIASLLVEADRHIPGCLDLGTGKVTLGDLADPQVDDLLDDLAELTLNKGGRIAVVPPAEMPTATGVAAIFRF